MSDMFDKFIEIRPYTGGNLAELQKAAHGDHGHTILQPSQILYKAGEIVGALEIGTAITTLVWMHTEKTNIRDSVDAMRFWENQIFGNGRNTLILPCKKTSPFMEYLKDPRSKYIDAGEFNLFVKKA